MVNKNKQKTILITGGLGFIGSVYGWHLNQQGFNQIVYCDHFRQGQKWKNIRGLEFQDIITPEQAVDYIKGALPGQKNVPESVLHLGACSSTTEEDMDFLFSNNYEFSKQLWDASTEMKIPFFYASSAASYGNGKTVGEFSTQLPLSSLHPLNKYGYSKQLFDSWVEKQIQARSTPPAYAGIKFFNVFGPHEYHKGSMSSVVYHAYHQVKATGRVKLFKSYHSDYDHGHQVRDFVYIKDVCRGIDLIIESAKKIAPTDPEVFLYNLGSGQSHTFIDLVTPIFKTLNLKINIEFIEMPESLRPNYQYFTQAEMPQEWKEVWQNKIKLSQAVSDYVRHLDGELYLSAEMENHYLG